MGANVYGYVDGDLIGSYPLEEIHTYIKRLVQAGFGKGIDGFFMDKFND